MNYVFQSRDRNTDLVHGSLKAYFRVFSFSTGEEKTAEFVRRNCKKNPHLFWEVTATPVAETEQAEPEKKKVGRPAILRGMRTQAEAEGVPA